MYFCYRCHYLNCLNNLVSQVFKMDNLRYYKMLFNGGNPLVVGDRQRWLITMEIQLSQCVSRSTHNLT